MVDSDEESEDELLDFADKIGINTSAIRNHGGLNKLIQRRAKRFALASHYAKLLQRRYRIKAAKNEFARLALEKENRFVHAEATLMQVRIFPLKKVRMIRFFTIIMLIISFKKHHEIRLF